MHMKNVLLNDVLKHVLFWLRDHDITPTKMLIQKFLFFLQERGVVPDYDFEPYAYGPFSRHVREAAAKLDEIGEINVEHTEYKLNDSLTDTLPSKEKQEIDEHLEQFVEMLSNRFSFSNLEVYGTALYCIRALEENGMPVGKEAVIEEFRAWKGRKYGEEVITAAYDGLSFSGFNKNVY